MISCAYMLISYVTIFTRINSWTTTWNSSPTHVEQSISDGHFAYATLPSTPQQSTKSIVSTLCLCKSSNLLCLFLSHYNRVISSFITISDEAFLFSVLILSYGLIRFGWSSLMSWGMCRRGLSCGALLVTGEKVAMVKGLEALLVSWVVEMTETIITPINNTTMSYRNLRTISPTPATHMRTSSPPTSFYSPTFSTFPLTLDTLPSTPLLRTSASTYLPSPYSSLYPYYTSKAKTFSSTLKYLCTLLVLGWKSGNY